MKQDEVVLNALYWAKVSDKVVKVRIVREAKTGGWWAYNTETGREVRIKTAQRLRGRVELRD